MQIDRVRNQVNREFMQHCVICITESSCSDGLIWGKNSIFTRDSLLYWRCKEWVGEGRQSQLKFYLCYILV